MVSFDFIIALAAVLLFIICILQYFEIKRINNKMELTDKVKNTLCTVSEKILHTNSEKEIYDLILYTAVELMPSATKGSILLLGEDNIFRFNAVIGFSEKLKDITLKKEEAYLFKLNNFSGTAIIRNPNKFNEATLDKNKIKIMKNLEAMDIKCTLSSPIYFEEKLIGLINIDSTVSEKAFTSDDVLLMNYIKSELQLALKNSFIHSKLRYMANFDELTGLFNRRYFKQFFNKELLRIKRYKTEVCLALLDLDDFKHINDIYGHNMGDRVLRFFADILRENIRKSDVYARMSGDEFVILFIDCSKEKAIKRLESIRESLKSKKLDNIDLSFSYGVCKINPDEDFTPDDIFGAADKEMYKDKNGKVFRKK